VLGSGRRHRRLLADRGLAAPGRAVHDRDHSLHGRLQRSPLDVRSG